MYAPVTSARLASIHPVERSISMSTNWLDGLHLAEGPDRTQAMPVFAGQAAGVVAAGP
jgi:hypothetical protein